MINTHAPIGELVDVVKNWNPTTRPQDEFLYIDLSAVSQNEKRVVSPGRVVGAEAPSRARQLVRQGDILVSTVRPNLNGVAAVTNEFDGATASTGFCVLRPKAAKLATEYLMHWVQSPTFIDNMVREATGASYPAVSDRIVKSSLIPLPPLDEQRRIAAILDKADALRRKRKRALELLDGLTQSIFLEMFGDPREHVSRWSRQVFSEACADLTARSEKLQRSEYLSAGKFPIIDQGQDFIAGWTDNVEVVTKVSKPVVIFGDHTRSVKFVDFDFVVGADGAKVLYPSINFGALFFSHLLRLMPIPDLGYSRHMRAVKELSFPCPPAELQAEFELKARCLASERQKCSSSLKVLDTLFSSLQHRAFTGQL